MAQTVLRKLARFALIALLAIVVLVAAYTWIVLSWSYANGERAGYVQKLSKKGWVCKTWEGELAMVNLPGATSEKFQFTVRDDAVAKKINEQLGSRVVLSYEQHVGVPTSCFGDTSYFVTDSRVISDEAQQAPTDQQPPTK